MAAGGAGVTGFTFTGSLNDKADWTKVMQGIKITATYAIANAEATDTVITGTGAMVNVAPTNAAPAFTTGSAVGTIDYTAGVGDDGLKEINKIEMSVNGGTYDGYNALGSTWAAATDSNGTITFDSKYIKFYAANATTEATITYTTNADETKTATVDVTTSEP